ncbi:MAG: hypothetical protein HY922_15855 [Elusimicrobia bacterium]|nr:hypothetical protein [Elusimicrobiota bacterium]
MRTYSGIAAALALLAAAAVGCDKSYVKGGQVASDIEQNMVTRKYIQSIGIGASDPALPTDTQRKSLARDAAIVKAQYEMLTLVKGVEIEGGITVSQAIEKDSNLEARIKDVLKGAEIVRSQFTSDNGCLVTLRLKKTRLEKMMGVKFK